MAVTPNYSWPVPDDTDLVKDGAEAIRDLGNAIDTTVDNLPSGGLVHIETRTVSAVASENFNDVFSADFDNYKILTTLVPTAGITLLFRFRVAGSDDSTTNYNFQSLRVSSTTVDGGRSTGQTSWTIANFGEVGSIKVPFEITISSPFLAEKKGFISLGGNGVDGARISGHGGISNHTTSFTGFSLLTSSGTVSGKVQIFGYKD